MSTPNEITDYEENQGQTRGPRSSEISWRGAAAVPIRGAGPAASYYISAEWTRRPRGFLSLAEQKDGVMLLYWVQVENEKAPLCNITEEAKSVSTPAEFSLQSLIIDAFHGHGFDKIKEYLQQKENSHQKYNKFLLIYLDRLINKELDKNEFQYVSLLLNCIQRFFTENRKEDEQLLIQQGLIPKMVSWFERTIEFLNTGGLTTTISLVQVLEDFFNTALVISKCSHKGKIQLLDSFLFNLGLLIADKTINYLIRQEGLRTLNSILEKMPQVEREKFPLSDDKCFLMKGLAKAIPETGDYDLQAALSEALCRMVSKKSRADLAYRWFEDDIIASAFKEIRDREFETDSRKFLNCLNDRLGDKRRVCTFPCVAVFVDGYELKKPHDENLEKFWIDFNIESKSITFYIDNTEGLLWDSVRLLKEAIGGFSIKEAEKKILVIYMRKSLLFNNKEVKKIEIHFDLQTNILTTCMKVFGKDKYLSNPDETKKEEPPEMFESFEEEDTIEILSCHEEKSAQEPTCQKESVNDGKTDSLHEPSQLAEQSETTKSVVSNTSANFLELESPNQEVIASKWNSLDGLKEMDKILVPKLNEEPSCSNSFVSLTTQTFQEDLLKVDGLEKGRKGTISSKNIPETKENPYDFGNSSDTMYSQVVVEAKQRIFSHKKSSLKKRDSSTLSSYKSQGKRKLFDDLRKHLFSESNYESSSSMSGSSWINSQKENKLKTYSKQKKPRVRRKLRVLPLLSSSSSSDHQNATPVWKRTSRQNKEKNPDFPVVTFQSSTAFLTPEDSTKKQPFQSVSPLEDTSSPEHSEVTDNLTKSASPKSSMKSANLKRKLQNVEASDSYDSTLLKLKQSKLEEDNTSFPPVALMPGENPFCSALQVLPDSLGESAVIFTLENYTKQLKKKFESRNKKKDICSRNAMKASEKLAMLLNQIHQCRLDKLEQFHKSVLQELDNFKKDVQALKDLEKEVLDFWKEQFTKLNSFCDLQMQSLNHLRKR
ncbi:synaptonemal complex protein 2-like [Gracilinanus agilis]|uniref:synaptonemal complex protein 2-like n=1 Tax=Gracilinanus agilis TaxID=191870 RepID=UPI001CFF29C3|nr:synaptonemal complex protein 2-like [Gracilinanus agilis]